MSSFNEIRASLTNSPPFNSKHILMSYPFGGTDEFSYLDRETALNALKELEEETKIVLTGLKKPSASFQILLQLFNYHTMLNPYASPQGPKVDPDESEL